VELRWADLTEEEREDVREAFTIARGRERLIYRQVKGRTEHDLIGELEAFAGLIDRLSLEAKNLLGPLRDEAVAGEIEPANALEQLRHHLDVLVGRNEPAPGRAEQMARREAVEVLVDIWVARGGKPILGKTWREKGGTAFHPNAFTRFLAESLCELDPALNSLEAAASAAHSALGR
jgi:hypothetical protein